MSSFWSRYSLKRRVDGTHESLTQRQRQSLAYREVQKVKVDCSFLPDSEWGVIGARKASPAWLLYLDFKINQPRDCCLTNAKVEVQFRQLTREGSNQRPNSHLGPIITDYYGPQNIDQGEISRYVQSFTSEMVSATTSGGTTIDICRHKWSLRGEIWPLPWAEDKSGFPRQIDWLVEDLASHGKFRLGLIVVHDTEPFSITVNIDGKIQGLGNRVFRTVRSASHTAGNQRSFVVKPTGACQRALDDVASKLNQEMTQLNIQNFSRVGTLSSLRSAEVSDVDNTYTHDAPRVEETTRNRHEEYTVAWICALPVEMAAAKAMFDEIHPNLPMPQGNMDHYHYALGEIGSHKIVLACLPDGVYGTTSAAILATHILYTFKGVRIRLMVGIGGGVPSPDNDIRLGDVVVSRPTGRFGGVIQYDLGKQVGSRVQNTGTLNKPPHSLLTAVAILRTEEMMAGSKVHTYVEGMLKKYPTMAAEFGHPGSEQDQLFKADYDHVQTVDNSSATTCHGCDSDNHVQRSKRKTDYPIVHYGLIGSGNQVMRHGATRDQLAKELGVLCFEMEAAGLMDNFPCLVIRGICDYADSHKNKDWQGYAAATAAGYAKNLLSVISATQICREAVVS